tara:strand:+ start:2774 stop:3508 length:735 start_codon:yes stop_codon:yes gene_type:complete
MKSILPLIVASAMASPVLGQSFTVTGMSSANSVEAGCQMSNPPTVGNCWDCFQELLADCDDNNPEGTRRQACYEAANNFFTWCLGRVGNNRSIDLGRASLNYELNGDKSFDVRTDMQYEMFIPAGTDIEDISVFIRYFNGTDTRQIQLDPTEFFIFDQTGVDDLFLIVLDTDLDVGMSNSVGIVTGVQNDAGEIDYGFAFGASVVDSFDIDGNGVFDNADRIAAMGLFSQGKMDHATLTRIIRE